MKDLQIYENAQFGQIRTSVTGSGEPMFCLADVCKVLGIGNPSDVKRNLKQDGVVTIEGVSLTTNQHGKTTEQKVMLTFISEANIYKCIFRSRKKEAEAFQDWVCEEVLPSIRKHGAYATPQTIQSLLDNPDMGIELFKQLKEERERAQALRQTLAEQAPKIEYVDTVLSSVSTLTSTQVAKEIGMSAVRFHKLLVGHGIIFKESGTYMMCQPYDQYGFAQTKTCAININGNQCTKHSLVWTESGRRFIHALKAHAFNGKAALKSIYSVNATFTA